MTARGLPGGAVVLRAGTASARVLTYGARIAASSFGGAPVFVSYGDDADNRDDEAYLGAVLGRVSGRIGGATLPMGDDRFDLDANAGDDQLHGGGAGFSRRVWDVAEAGADRLVLTLASEDGDQGFPGRLDARVAFALREGALRVDYEARADAPTPVSLTHHPYVRLSGGDVLDHTVQANAAAWTPLTAAGIPTGEVRDVAGTPLDLSAPRRVGDVIGALTSRGEGGLDHGIVCPGGVRVAVSDGQRTLTVASDQTHCQLFGAGTLGDPPGRHCGLAVEPQGWPDAEKHEGFEGRVLRPGQVYRRWVTYSVD